MNRTTEENTPEESALLEDFGTILESGGTTLTIVPEIQRMKYAKNMWNVVFASFSTLTWYVCFSYIHWAVKLDSVSCSSISVTLSQQCFVLLLRIRQILTNRTSLQSQPIS